MKSFYSILTVPIRPSSQEQLTIGLLLVDDRNLLFKFSTRKLEFIKKLLPENSFNLLKSYIFGLTEKLTSEDERMRIKFSKTEFVSYLSNYNSNLLIFSKPTPIELEVNGENFQKLFEKFIFQYELDLTQDVLKESVTLKERLKLNLYPKIKERVNLNQTITVKEVPNLLVPSVKVNFIGQNNLPVAGHSVDFESTTASISNSISKLISLIKAFDMDNKKGQYYIIGKEPDKKAFAEQHSNWQHIRQSNLIEFVDVDDMEQIASYVEQHNVRPFVVG
ncbi:MAG: hypothetical protein ACKVOQ_17210 [Cyclobacteriaceae bacterium]